MLNKLKTTRREERENLTEAQLKKLFELKYFRNDRYGKLSDGIKLEFMITEHCNLNCAGCDHIASIAKEKFMSLEEYSICLHSFKEKLPTIKEICFMGGEPLLHPQLDQVFILTRELFPDVDIVCYTNGLLLSKFNEKYNQLCRDLKVGFMLSVYPNNFDYEKLMEECKETNLQAYLRPSEILFRMPIVNPYGTEDKEQFYTCTKTQPPVFTIRDYKLYKCPFCCCIDNITNVNKNIVIPETENDYLDVLNFTFEELVEFCYKPNDRCAYCKEIYNDNNYWLWHQQHNNKNNFLYDLKDYYLYDYDEYEKIMNNADVVYQVFKNPYYLDIFDYSLADTISDKMQTKFLNSKIDIIIPYHNITEKMINDLKKSLMVQTSIKDYTLIFISDNSPYEELVYDAFNYQFTCTFLKTKERSGPGVARNLGLKYSFSDYVFFLDFDDCFYENDSLNKLYNFIIENNYPDMIDCKIITDTNEDFLMNKYCIKKEFLITNKISFPPFFMYEDKYFNLLCNLYNPEIVIYNEYLYKYNTQNILSLGKESKNNIICNFLSLFKFLLDYGENCSLDYLNELFLLLINGNNVFNEKEQYDQKQISLYVSILLVLTTIIYNKYKYKIKDIDIKQLNYVGSFIYESIKQDKFIVSMNNHITYTFESLRKKVFSYLNTLNDLFINSILKEGVI